MATMKENKVKGIAGDEVVQSGDEALNQTHPPTSSTVKLIPPTSSEKRKTVSKRLDTSNLPNCRGNKKLKVDSSTPSTVLVMVLNHATPVAKPKVDAFLTRLDIDPSKPPPIGPPDSGLMTFLRSEGLTWDRFEQAVTNKDIPHPAKDGPKSKGDALVVYLSKFKFQVEILLSLICFLFSFFAFLGGGGVSDLLDHLNFFKYITSSMFKDEVP